MSGSLSEPKGHGAWRGSIPCALSNRPKKVITPEGIVLTTDMANSATPTAEFIAGIKFGDGVTTTTLSKSLTKLTKLGNEAFDQNLYIGFKLMVVKDWWTSEGKDSFEEQGLSTNWQEAVPHLTGLSKSAFNKKVKAYRDSVEHPELLEEYRALEANAGRECNMDRWAQYVKDGSFNEPTEEEGEGESKAKNLGQFQVTGITAAVRITADGLIDTKSDEDGIVCGLAVLKASLIASGMERAAEAIVLPEELENGETAEEVAGRFFAEIGK